MTGTSLISRMAERRHLDPQTYYRTIKHTLMPSTATDEQIAAFLMVADRYNLDPLLKEIHAFPNRKGTGITPVVSIDGFINLVNSHPQCDGFDFSYERDKDGRLISCTCRMYRRDRSHPIVVTEFYSETYRNTDPWNQMPARMLRHKAFKEAARLAFGFAGIADEDEARDIAMVAPTGSGPALERIDASPSPVMDELDQFVAGHPSTLREPQDPGYDPDTGEIDAAGTSEPGGGARDGSSETRPPAADAAAAPAQDDAAAAFEASLSRQDAIDRLLALATDKATTRAEKLESLDLLKPAYEDSQGPDFVGAGFPIVARVMKGELAPPAAKKFLAQLKS